MNKPLVSVKGVALVDLDLLSQLELANCFLLLANLLN